MTVFDFFFFPPHPLAAVFRGRAAVIHWLFTDYARESESSRLVGEVILVKLFS